VSRRDDKPALSEYPARWAAEHICLRCSHNVVCKVSNTLDPVLRPAISLCRMFEPICRGVPS
jgi:hypothetical protein